MEHTNTPGYTPTPSPLSAEMEREISATHPWMRFVAIMGFVFLGIMLLAMLTLGATIPNMEGGIAIVVMLIVVIIFIFPIIYLLQSANSYKDFLLDRDQHALVNAVRKSKAYWRFLCILLIINLVLQVIGLVFIFAGGSMFNFM